MYRTWSSNAGRQVKTCCFAILSGHLSSNAEMASTSSFKLAKVAASNYQLLLLLLRCICITPYSDCEPTVISCEGWFTSSWVQCPGYKLVQGQEPPLDRPLA